MLSETNVVTPAAVDRTSVPAPNVRPADVAAQLLAEFRAIHRRVPRVLHIGNIANNAYLNAKILNRAGFDCDVICHDYYHIMGCPEWEECDFAGVIDDHFKPDWTKVDCGGYQRPRWFAQGPRELCIEYLIAKRSGQKREAERLWRELSWANRTSATSSVLESRFAHATARLRHYWSTARRFARRARSHPNPYSHAWDHLRGWADRRGAAGFLITAAATPFLMIGLILIRARHYPNAHAIAWQRLHSWAERHGLPGYVLAGLAAPFLMLALWLLQIGRSPREQTQAEKAWVSEFKEAFPERGDQLTIADYGPFLVTLPEWTRLFSHYDIVQAYSTDVLYPMLAGKKPYVGFEHGTLRVFTMGDDPLSRLTALGYHRADHVLITNGDCLEYAQRIKVRQYTPMPHPFDDMFMRGVPGNREALHDRYQATYLFLCPLRHDWAIKGTDKYIRALPAIAARLGRSFKLIMTRWGGQIEESLELAKALGVADLIAWSEPFNRVDLIRHLKSVDVVFDQIALPCFGGTAPQAIATGVPVIMSYDPRSTEWLIPEAAPILTAWSVDEIVQAVMTALDPAWRAQYLSRAGRWYDRYHSSHEVVQKHARVYDSISRTTGLLPAR